MGSHWQLYALGSAFFAGLTAVLAKVGVSGLPSNTATLIRTLVVCIFLSILVGLRQEWMNPLTLDRKSLIFLVLFAIATGLSWILYFRALQIGNAAVVSSLDKLSLSFTVILSILFLGEHLFVWQWVGVGLTILGAFLIAWK
jgi:transporter family protein